MKFLFDTESFSFETLRTAGFAAYGGAELVLAPVVDYALTRGEIAADKVVLFG